MKKSIVSFLVLTVVLFSACAQQKKATTNAKDSVVSSAKAPTTAGEMTTKGSSMKQFSQIAMERTPCFGTCAAYRVEVNKDGSVRYISRHFTEYEGTYEKKFDASKVEELYKEFSSYRVDTCAEKYESLIQDVPGIMYYITYADNSEQVIRNAHFGPRFLKVLAKEVDKFSQVDDNWTKTADKEEN